MLIIPSPSCLCHAMSFARSLLQLLALPSITQASVSPTRVMQWNSAHTQLFSQTCLQGVKKSWTCLTGASVVQHKPKVTGLCLNNSSLQKDNPPSSDTWMCKAALPPPGSLKHLQNRADLLASIIPPSTPAVWVFSPPPQLSKLRSSCTSKLCSTTDQHRVES